MPTRSRKAERIRRAWPVLLPFLAVAAWSAGGVVSYAMALRLFMVPSASMAPTIARGDRVAVEMHRSADPARGEIWVLTLPNGGMGIKRVIGLPGESVEVAGGRVLIDGRPLDEPYLAGPIAYAMPPVRLPAGEYFVLGDNRNVSNDSHVWGPAPRPRLLGRADYRSWPPTPLNRRR